MERLEAIQYSLPTPCPRPVFDKDQLERIIKKHSSGVNNLQDKLKYWDCEEVCGCMKVWSW